jgi:hypothetical protein
MRQLFFEPFARELQLKGTADALSSRRPTFKPQTEKEATMKLKSLVIAVLALSATGAMAGEIVYSNVNAANVANTAAGLGSSALQNIGVAE